MELERDMRVFVMVLDGVKIVFFEYDKYRFY